jgi:transcriptional/translational regulatory protein YebC/TACO1
LRRALQAAELQTEVAAIVMKAESEVMLSNEDAQRMQKLLDALDQLDDVQEVYTNAVLDL